MPQRGHWAVEGQRPGPSSSQSVISEGGKVWRQWKQPHNVLRSTASLWKEQNLWMSLRLGVGVIETDRDANTDVISKAFNPVDANDHQDSLLFFNRPLDQMECRTNMLPAQR